MIDYMYLYELDADSITREIEAAQAALEVIQNDWHSGGSPKVSQFLIPASEKAIFEIATFIKHAQRIEKYEAQLEEERNNNPKRWM